MDPRVSKIASLLRRLWAVAVAVTLTCVGLQLVRIQELALYGLRRWPTLTTRVAWLFPIFLAIALLVARLTRARNASAAAAVLRGAVLGLIAGWASLATSQLQEPFAMERLARAFHSGWMSFVMIQFLATLGTLGWLYGAIASILEFGLERRNSGGLPAATSSSG